MAHKINILVNPAAVALCDRLNACSTAEQRDRLLKDAMAKLASSSLTWDDLVWAAAWGCMEEAPEGVCFVGYDEWAADRYLLRLERELVEEWYPSRQDE